MARKLLSTPEAASLMGIQPATLRSWRLRGRGPPYEQPAGRGTAVVYAPENVDLFILRRNEGRKK